MCILTDVNRRLGSVHPLLGSEEVGTAVGRRVGIVVVGDEVGLKVLDATDGNAVGSVLGAIVGSAVGAGDAVGGRVGLLAVGQNFGPDTATGAVFLWRFSSSSSVHEKQALTRQSAFLLALERHPLTGRAGFPQGRTRSTAVEAVIVSVVHLQLTGKTLAQQAPPAACCNHATSYMKNSCYKDKHTSAREPAGVRRFFLCVTVISLSSNHII